MVRSLTVLVTLATLALAGCVSKSTHDEVQTQLDECRADKQAAQTAAGACEKRYDREISRFDDLDSALSEAVPDALQTFRSEREQVLEQVPVQVREEVESYLDEFATAVARSFQRLSDDNVRILTQLDLAKVQINKLGADTESLIAAGVDETIQEVRVSKATRAQQAAMVAEVVNTILAFDQVRINCKSCEDRLRLNRRERETITAFHASLVAQLQGISMPSAEGGEDEPMPPVEPVEPMESMEPTEGSG